MNSFDTSLLVVETASLTSGIQAHEAIATEKGVKIVLAASVGENRYAILATGPLASLEAGFKAANSKVGHDDLLVDHEIFETFDRHVLESALALSQTKLDEGLVVIETESVSAAFEVTQALVQHHGLKPIELRIRRSSRGAHAYLTGKAAACAPAVIEAQSLLKQSARQGTAEGFEHPSPALRSQFDFV